MGCRQSLAGLPPLAPSALSRVTPERVQTSSIGDAEDHSFIARQGCGTTMLRTIPSR
jgi:hypothetical protein